MCLLEQLHSVYAIKQCLEQGFSLEEQWEAWQEDKRQQAQAETRESPSMYKGNLFRHELSQALKQVA